MRRALLSGVAIGAGLLLAGCGDKITGDAEQVGEPALTFGLTNASARAIPSGTSSIRATEITLSNSLAPDAFNRANDLFLYQNIARPQWEFLTAVRNSTTDPRFPLLKPQSFATSFVQVYGPENFNRATADDQATRAFELFVRFTGLPAARPYSLRLVRYGLKVNGTNDAIERLAFGTITQPDELIPFGGAPNATPGTSFDWVSLNASCNNKLVPVGANPFELGPATTTSAGQLTFDKCFSAAPFYYQNKTKVVTDSLPFYRNSLGTSSSPQQYNYLEVTEGSTPGGPIIARVQIGPDLDPTTGARLPNTFAPFPTTAIPPATLISIGAAEGGPTAVQISVGPLEPLAGGAMYKIVLVDRIGGRITPVRALYWTVKADTTGRDENTGAPIVVTTTSAKSAVSAIPGGATNVTHFVEVADSLNTGIRLREYTDVALQPPAATTGVPLWAVYRLDPNGTPNDTRGDQLLLADSVRFGGLPIAPNATPRLFRPSGRAVGTNRGGELAIVLDHLPRPPFGFRYEVWLVPKDAAGAPVSLGGLTTPLPELASLDDADVAPNGPALSTTLILNATVLLRPAQVRALGHDLSDFGTIRLTLEPKDGPPTQSSIVVLEGPFVGP